MKPEQLVTNRELSQKLYDAGIVLDTYFYWQGYLHSGQKVELVTKRDLDNDYDHIPAPMSAELGEVIGSYKIDLWMYHNAGRFILSSETHNVGRIDADTEVNARAKMLLYLKENNLLPVENTQ